MDVHHAYPQPRPEPVFANLHTEINLGLALHACTSEIKCGLMYAHTPHRSGPTELQRRVQSTRAYKISRGNLNRRLTKTFEWYDRNGGLASSGEV